MKVYLIRHASAFVDMTGQKPVKQWHLKPEGAALSGQLGEVVGGLERPPQLLISSSQLKAFETGAHMARALGVPLALNDAFGEVSAGVSKFLGPRYAEIMKYLFEHQDASLFGEANFADAKARFTEGLAALVREQQLAGLESLGIVSHSGVLSLAYQSFAGGELEEIEKSMKFPDVAALEFKENGSFEGLIEPFGQHLLVPPVIPEEEKEAHKVIIDEIDQALPNKKQTE